MPYKKQIYYWMAKALAENNFMNVSYYYSYISYI